MPTKTSPTSPVLLTSDRALWLLKFIDGTSKVVGPNTVEALKAIESGSAVVVPALPDGETFKQWWARQVDAHTDLAHEVSDGNARKIWQAARRAALEK